MTMQQARQTAQRAASNAKAISQQRPQLVTKLAEKLATAWGVK